MFEIDKGKHGGFFWRLKNPDTGETLCVSELYTQKAAAYNGIESIIKNAAKGIIVDLTEK
jgi:hypothetical protein